MEPKRISPEEVRQKAGSGALLVCAYEDEERCNSIKLEGSITFGEFKRTLASLSKDQDITFYCA